MSAYIDDYSLFISVRSRRNVEKLKTGTIVVFAVLLIVIIIVSLIAVNVFQNSQNDTSSNAQLNNAGYLDSRGQTKLFLVSGNASYGVYSANAAWNGGMFDCQKDCFVITATIRSDYTLEELQSFSVNSDGSHSGRVYFAVSVTLYDGTSQVLADDVTSAITGQMSPPLGVPQWCLYCGETDTVEIYLSTSNRNIDSYSINLKILELSGLPIP
jgi:hypothetical protein